MQPAQQVIEAIEQSGAIGILRAAGKVDLVAIVQALLAGGLKALEITLNTPGALQEIARVRHELGQHVILGAGTILEASDAQLAIDAGARFIVTPTLQLDSIALCKRLRVPIICGAMTPTEMLAAHRAGATYIKLFPAGSLGLDYIKAVRAPMPFLKIIPTGGVNLANIDQFLHAGCPAVAVGNHLIDPKLIAQRRWDDLAALAHQFAQAARKAQQQPQLSRS